MKIDWQLVLAIVVAGVVVNILNGLVDAAFLDNAKSKIAAKMGS